MKPEFTYEEIGAYLIAVGNVVADYDLCVGAALDGGSDEMLIRIMKEHGVSDIHAETLCRLDPLDAINFVMEP